MILYPSERYFSETELLALCHGSFKIPKTKKLMKLQATYNGLDLIPNGDSYAHQERYAEIVIERNEPKEDDNIVILPSHVISTRTISESRAAQKPKFSIKSIMLNGSIETTYKKLVDELAARPTVVKSVMIQEAKNLDSQNISLEIHAKTIWGNNVSAMISSQNIYTSEGNVYCLFDLGTFKKFLTGKNEFSITGLGVEPIIKIRIDFNESYDLLN